MKQIKFKKWLLGGSITGALVLGLVGNFTYSSVSEFFYPSKEVITKGDKETHQGINRIEELLLGQGKVSEEINGLLKQLLGDDYETKLENEAVSEYLEKKLQTETVEEILQEKDKFIEETDEIMKIGIVDLRELSASELNLLAERSPVAMTARLKNEDKIVIEAISKKHSYSYNIIHHLSDAGYSKEIINDVIDVADLRKLHTSELNLLAKRSPVAMLERLKGENKIVIEEISKKHSYSYNIIHCLANAGYSKEVIEEVIDVADLRELHTSELNLLAEKSPAAMLARLKGENKIVIEAISKGHNYSYNVIHYLSDAGYSKEIINDVIDVADLRKLHTYELNLLAERSPVVMLARLKGEDKIVIEYLEDKTKVLEYANW